MEYFFSWASSNFAHSLEGQRSRSYMSTLPWDAPLLLCHGDEIAGPLGLFPEGQAGMDRLWSGCENGPLVIDHTIRLSLWTFCPWNILQFVTMVTDLNWIETKYVTLTSVYCVSNRKPMEMDFVICGWHFYCLGRKGLALGETKGMTAFTNRLQVPTRWGIEGYSKHNRLLW